MKIKHGFNSVVTVIFFLFVDRLIIICITTVLLQIPWLEYAHVFGFICSKTKVNFHKRLNW